MQIRRTVPALRIAVNCRQFVRPLSRHFQLLPTTINYKTSTAT